MKVRERTRPLRDDVRAGVLEAAGAVFAEVGYHRASLARIAERAGFSKGAVYSNFASKDDLFFALVEPEAVRMAEVIAARIGSSGHDVEARLQALASGLVDMVATSPANLLFAEFRAHAARDPELSARVADVRAVVVGVLADRLDVEVARSGGRLRVPAQQAVVLMLALVNGLALEQVGVAGSAVDPAAVAQLLRGLLAPADPPEAEAPRVG